MQAHIRIFLAFIRIYQNICITPVINQLWPAGPADTRMHDRPARPTAFCWNQKYPRVCGEKSGQAPSNQKHLCRAKSGSFTILCPSAVNGPAQIRQSPKIVPSFLCKNAPASCCGNRGVYNILLSLMLSAPHAITCGGS